MWCVCYYVSVYVYTFSLCICTAYVLYNIIVCLYLWLSRLAYVYFMFLCVLSYQAVRLVYNGDGSVAAVLGADLSFNHFGEQFLDDITIAGTEGEHIVKKKPNLLTRSLFSLF